jgi:UPF0716 protein FxsA
MWFAGLVILLVAELWVFVKVAEAIGFWWALFAAIGISVLGLWLVKWQGLGVFRRLRLQVEQGNRPTKELADGAMILVAGLLLLFPGFITGVMGLLLLLPPVRAVMRPGLVRRFSGRGRVITATYVTMPPDAGGPARGRGPIDATASDEPEPPAGELGP